MLDQQFLNMFEHALFQRFCLAPYSLERLVEDPGDDDNDGNNIIK